MNIKHIVLICVVFCTFSFMFYAEQCNGSGPKKRWYTQERDEMELLVVGDFRAAKGFDAFLKKALDSYEIEPFFEYEKDGNAALQRCDKEQFDVCLYLLFSPSPTPQVNGLLKELAALTKSNSVLLIQLNGARDEFYESYNGWYADREWRKTMASGIFLSDHSKEKKKLFLFGLHNGRIDRRLIENRKMIKHLARLLSKLVQ